MITHGDNVSLRFFNALSVKRFISGNKDNSVKTVKVIEKLCRQW